MPVRLLSQLLIVLTLITFIQTPNAHAQEDAFAEFIKNGGDWILRARATANIPQESEEVRPVSVGGDYDVAQEFSGDLSLTYFLKDRLGIEFNTSYIQFGSVKLEDTNTGTINVGEFTVVPLMAFLQYHFDPVSEIHFTPYVGAGAGYWWFFDENDARGVTDVDVDSTVAYGLQFGVDWPINDIWALNFDAKRYWVDTEIQTKNPNTNSDFDLDPWVLGIGLGVKL